MGMQSTPAKRSKSIDTIPWHSSASRKTRGSVLDGGLGPFSDSEERVCSSSDTPQRLSDCSLSITHCKNPLESTSDRGEVYQDVEVPIKFGSSFGTPPSMTSTGSRSIEHRTPMPRQLAGRNSAPPSEASFITHYDITAPLNDESGNTPSLGQRRASSKIASRQPTPRPRLDLPPSDPPWPDTPSPFRYERTETPYQDPTDSPELARRRYPTCSPLELLDKATPPSPLHFGRLGDTPVSDTDFPSALEPAQEIREYNPDREERALQPDPFGFFRLQAITEGPRSNY